MRFAVDGTATSYAALVAIIVSGKLPFFDIRRGVSTSWPQGDILRKSESPHSQGQSRPTPNLTQP